MTTHVGIRLADHLDDFIRQQLSLGHFASREDVIEAALQLLQEREIKRAAWRAAFEKAERESIPPPPPGR